MSELKKFKCTLWGIIEKKACPQVLATKVVEEKSYEELLEKYNTAPNGTYCLVEEII